MTDFPERGFGGVSGDSLKDTPEPARQLLLRKSDAAQKRVHSWV